LQEIVHQVTDLEIMTLWHPFLDCLSHQGCLLCPLLPHALFVMHLNGCSVYGHQRRHLGIWSTCIIENGTFHMTFKQETRFGWKWPAPLLITPPRSLMTNVMDCSLSSANTEKVHSNFISHLYGSWSIPSLTSVRYPLSPLLSFLSSKNHHATSWSNWRLWGTGNQRDPQLLPLMKLSRISCTLEEIPLWGVQVEKGF